MAASKGKRDTQQYEESATDSGCGAVTAKETVVAVSGDTVISCSTGAGGVVEASDPDGSSVTRKCCIGGGGSDDAGGGGGIVSGRGNGNKGGPGSGRYRGGGYSLCHRLTTHSSTTSDIQQSTSATAETIATSSGLIVSSRQGSVDGAMQRCGLCSLLSRLLRRAMCVGSRRGSGESYYQELAETAVSSFFSMLNLGHKKISFARLIFLRILLFFLSSFLGCTPSFYYGGHSLPLTPDIEKFQSYFFFGVGKVNAFAH